MSIVAAIVAIADPIVRPGLRVGMLRVEALMESLLRDEELATDAVAAQLAMAMDAAGTVVGVAQAVVRAEDPVAADRAGLLTPRPLS